MCGCVSSLTIAGNSGSSQNATIGMAQRDGFGAKWGGKRKAAGGKVPAVGDTVDRAKATYRNTIGAAELRATWTDPDFTPGQRAFYYVRVLEIPTPRWPLYDAVRFGFKLTPEAMADAVAQERAYSSPVWIGPAEGSAKPATALFDRKRLSRTQGRG